MSRSAPRAVIMIPARYESSRYPGKPLASLRGRGGRAKPLIQRSWEAARRVPGIEGVYVVTDHGEIAGVAAGFGADVLMTSPDCRNGTERCGAALAQLEEPPELVVNLQGDAPLTPPYFVTALIEALADRDEEVVATPAIRCDAEHFARLKAEEAAGRVGGTTVVTDTRDRALYFSKRLIPYCPPSAIVDGMSPVRLHVGVYAYTPAALRAYLAQPPSPLEELEGLEQLRFLNLGMPIRVVEVASPEWEVWELNNPSDVEPIERALALMDVE
jgi:3-deoxy-manno-octulosonate cytidylyltransferase (CMP-KDO synthetase)